jgi:hypothetical protein
MYYYYLETFEASTDIKKDDMNFPTTSINGLKANWMIMDECVSFAPCPPQACTVPCAKPAYKEPNKKEKTMYVDNDKHIESSKINYLSGRVENIYFKKDAELRKQFGLVNDESPETAVEMVKRIQDGKFIIKDEYKDKRTYGDAARYITWRDPAVKEDQAGYKAALKAFDVAHQDARDTIAIGTPAEGLAAIKALDAWTPTVGKS